MSLPENLRGNTEEEENAMKRQIFTLMIALVLVTGTALVAQTTGNTQQLPPSQQVDQSGQPETGSGPDVDVDAGANAEDGLVDVDVDANADSDTAAQGNDPNPTVGTTGTVTGRTGVTGTATTTTTTTGVDTDVDVNADVDTDVDASMDTETGSLPETASGMPLLGLIGLLALGGAIAIKTTR